MTSAFNTDTPTPCAAAAAVKQLVKDDKEAKLKGIGLQLVQAASSTMLARPISPSPAHSAAASQLPCLERRCPLPCPQRRRPAPLRRAPPLSPAPHSSPPRPAPVACATPRPSPLRHARLPAAPCPGTRPRSGSQPSPPLAALPALARRGVATLAAAGIDSVVFVRIFAASGARLER
ncbi:vegetative cell wall protein gp1-like [Sorghum bicolor]|uniref:vegetative cell wall protein gp1-like n=1 Tax=Sorghum bicolor TaxID=4558 RepID=UPI000B4252FF|nr:vegetative cell wall protein gp1-like [Sorghum bicolor]|eukprot:XP_021317774.1 vegetative cell wall protein gp1-like [Sorghum bicolor]